MTLDTYLWKHLLALAPRVGAGLVVFIAFWIGGLLLDRLIRRLGEARRVDPDISGLLARSAKIGMLLFGGVSGLGTFGINVTAMVAGLGLTGLALGLALKEILSNALAGVLLLIYKPFKRHDLITVLNFEGRVAEVNLRYTLLEGTGQQVFVPNTLLLTSAVCVKKA